MFIRGHSNGWGGLNDSDFVRIGSDRGARVLLTFSNDSNNQIENTTGSVSLPSYVALFSTEICAILARCYAAS